MKQDFWESDDGNFKLYHADCIFILPLLSGIDALITDPPYSSGGMVRGDRMASTRTKYQSSDANIEHPEFTGDNRDQRGFIAWASLWLTMAMGATIDGGVACLFSDWRQLPSMTDALQSGGWVWRGIVPWDKINARPMPNRFRAQCEYVVWGSNGPLSIDKKDATYHNGILRDLSPNIKERKHSTQKPVSIMSELVKIAKQGGTVLDPFMGSGTTGIACIKMGRKFIGIEKDAKYFEIAKERIGREMRQGTLF